MAPNSYGDYLRGIAEMFEKCPSILMDNEKDHSFFLSPEQRAAVIGALKERSCGPNGKTWTDGDFLDQALTNATGSILSQYAADVIRKRAIELRLSATGTPQEKT